MRPRKSGREIWREREKERTIINNNVEVCTGQTYSNIQPHT